MTVRERGAKALANLEQGLASASSRTEDVIA